MGRPENIQIFEDTMQNCKIHQRLVKSIRAAGAAQELILEADGFTLTKQPGDVPAEIVVSRKRSLEAAADYARAGKRVCVLNFASATNPGGGVTRGSTAQEEAICRCSTLYSCLIRSNLRGGFYAPHRMANDPLHNDDCIYTPGVCVFKTDDKFPRQMKDSMWYNVDIITCAAPNLRENPSNQMNSDGDRAAKISDEELRALHEKRMRRILSIAAERGDEVVILGAFGCGAFQNPPEVVAQALRTVSEEFRNYFETIEFAVYCPPNDDTNYRIFDRVLNG